ncbi:hypothetical protein WJX72_005025 [[Myrmecia] bisecta]|uniref:UBC core domain-containing protein n=1 Tax=[Myrmecia] bisecta TaxID=41462 RepID=A0AAW1P8M4_9CHLO
MDTCDLTTNVMGQPAAKRRKHQRAAQQYWECTACTFINENMAALQCELCAEKRPPEPGEWTCDRCTCINKQDVEQCSVCAAPNPSAASGSAARDDVMLLEDDSLPHKSQASGADGKGMASPSGAGGDIFVLDSCSCRHARADLAAHMQQRLQSLPLDLATLLGHFCCPKSGCGATLARRDLQHVLGAQAAKQVDAAIVNAAQRHQQWVAWAFKASSSLASPINCPACTTAPMAAVVGLATLSATELGDALKAHGETKLPRKQAERTGYGGGIEEHDGGYYHMADLPLGICAAVHGGPLALCLRWLLQNDSLMDIGKRCDLYREVLKLLQRLGSCMDCIPLLQRPAVYSSKRAAGGSSGSGDEEEDGDAPSVLDCLRVLNIQCDVFKRSAEELGEGADDVAVLSMALDIKDTFDQLSSAAASVQRAQPAAPTPTPAAQPDAQVDVDLTVDEGPASSRPANGDAQKQLEKRYLEALKPLRYTNQAVLEGGDFYFRQQAAAVSKQAGGGQQMKTRLRRLVEEHSSLSTSLPLAWGSSIFLAADDTRLDVLRALIIGPGPDSPYANGAFLFNILMPANYPSSPPSVQFLTTGGGRVGFNPNLYPCGKVCLSLLGTWSGPGWVPGESTLLQVLVSIQSMILVDDPYFNEPGFEGSRGSARGNAAAEDYNAELRVNTLKFGILTALEKPPPAFAEVLRHHFSLKKQEIEEQCQRWVAQGAAVAGRPRHHQYHTYHGDKEDIKQTAAKVCAALKKL